MPDKDAEKDARTLFVRNVAFSVDSAGLEQVFADIGPVRQCFLVTQKGGEGTKHRGIAFVQFAIPEDAQRAVEELNGRELAGRRLKIELAHKRAPLLERKQRKRAAAEADGDGVAHAQGNEEGRQQQLAAASKAGKPQTEPPAKRQKKQQQQQQDGAAAAAAVSAASAGQHSGQEKHKWVRTVALGGLSRRFLAHALQLAAAAGGLEEVLDPPPADVAAKAHLAQDGCSGETVFLVYATVKDATHAVTQLHNKTISPADVAAAEAAAAVAAEADSAAAGKKGKKGKTKQLGKQAAKQLKQQQVAAATAAAVAAGSEGGIVLWARTVSGEGALVKRWRLILRNLPFQATESDVRKLLAPSGAFAWRVQLPARPDGRSTGFAFAAFLSYHEAEKALKAANGQLLRMRPVAVDWALGKGQYQQLQQQHGAAAGQGQGAAGADGDAVQQESSHEEEEEEEEVSSEAADESAYDEQDSSSGEEQEEEEGLSSEENEGSDEDSGDGSDEGSEEEEISEGQDFDHDRSVLQSALEQVLAQEQQQKEQQQRRQAPEQQKKQQKKQQQAAGGDAAAPAAKSAAVAQTVFVRGLPLDVTSQELQARFDRFGPVKACRLVMDKATGKPKGTAFIEFRAPAGAAAAADACARARQGKGPDVAVKGVKLSVDLALSQDDARRLGQEQGGGLSGGQVDGQGGKFDRRNLYLAKEGFIEEGSPQWEAISENDRRKRKRAAEEKNQKLKSPNFAVSTTRLAVRNIPSSWGEAKLKACFIAGVKQRATKERPVVKQVKILRDPERPDPAGHPGGKSRGFGFVEFGEASHALAALRQLNNNPTAFGSADRRPIVEFAVDNVKVLKARQDKLLKQKAGQQQQKQQQQQEPAVDSAAGAAADRNAGDGEEEAQRQGAAAGADGGKTGSSSGQQQLSKRQLKRQKEKQRKLAKQQQQQANGAPAAAVAAAAVAAAAAAAAPGKLQQRGKPTAGGQKQQQQNGKRNSKKEAAAKAASAAAAAKAARLVAKSSRQQQQLQQEEALRGRKRRADAELDRLAAAGDDGGAGAGKGKQQQQHGNGSSSSSKKRHKPGRANEERLEQMVQDYKSKLFGLGGGGGAVSAGAGSKGQRQQQQQQRDSLKRWFE